MFIVQRGTKMLWGETVTLGCSLLKKYSFIWIKSD